MTTQYVSSQRSCYENISKENFEESVGKSLVAQNELECKQRHEHGEMFRELARLRDEQVKSLEADLKGQMEMSVGDVLRQLDEGWSILQNGQRQCYKHQAIECVLKKIAKLFFACRRIQRGYHCGKEKDRRAFPAIKTRTNASFAGHA